MTRLIGGTGFRTNEVIGTCEHYPKVGDSFVVLALPLNKHGSVRVVSTSPVKDVFNVIDNIVIIETLNSTYQLEIQEIKDRQQGI